MARGPHARVGVSGFVRICPDCGFVRIELTNLLYPCCIFFPMTIAEPDTAIPAEREAEAQLAVIRTLKTLTPAARKRVLEAVVHPLPAGPGRAAGDLVPGAVR